ncbi:MAG: aspartyl/asparaginyl beta-hydroxylase domain-containing protein, partial [Merismopedia sp. SIO2A8]|nr:aspartyl/asparaginyl beta-hydroxylase domain-containing protein [Merismopedia sp. SIO2A8]
MAVFSGYNLDPSQFPFLEPIQHQWLSIRDEFTHFITNASPDEMKWALTIMGPKSKTITTQGAAKYQAFGVLFQGQFIEDYIHQHHIKYSDGPDDPNATVASIREHYFPRLTQVIQQVNTVFDDILRNVYFG